MRKIFQYSNLMLIFLFFLSCQTRVNKEKSDRKEVIFFSDVLDENVALVTLQDKNLELDTESISLTSDYPNFKLSPKDVVFLHIPSDNLKKIERLESFNVNGKMKLAIEKTDWEKINDQSSQFELVPKRLRDNYNYTRIWDNNTQILSPKVETKNIFVSDKRRPALMESIEKFNNFKDTKPSIGRYTYESKKYDVEAQVLNDTPRQLHRVDGVLCDLKEGFEGILPKIKEKFKSQRPDGNLEEFIQNFLNYKQTQSQTWDASDTEMALSFKPDFYEGKNYISMGIKQFAIINDIDFKDNKVLLRHDLILQSRVEINGTIEPGHFTMITREVEMPIDPPYTQPIKEIVEVSEPKKILKSFYKSPNEGEISVVSQNITFSFENKDITVNLGAVEESQVLLRRVSSKPRNSKDRVKSIIAWVTPSLVLNLGLVLMVEKAKELEE